MSAHQCTLPSNVKLLSSLGLDSSHFHGCDGSKHTSITRPCRVIHSFVLHDSKPSFLPPYILLSLPLSSVELDLPFDPQPVWRRFPRGQLWDCIQDFFIATVSAHTLWHSDAHTCKNDKQEAVDRGRICSLPSRIFVCNLLIDSTYSESIVDQKGFSITQIQAQHC